MSKENDILNYMKKLDISREEAEQLWQDDHDEVITPEMEEMEKKAKQIRRFTPEMEEMEKKAKQIRRYEKSDAPKKARERKVDAEKKNILSCCRVLVEGLGGVVSKVNNEADFSFTFNGNLYTLKLVKHRAPK